MKKKRITRKERREKLEKLQIGWELVRLIRHFFPDLMRELKGVTDVRHPSYIRYENHVILMTRILAAIFYISSMRKASEEFRRLTVRVVKNAMKALEIQGKFSQIFSTEI